MDPQSNKEQIEYWREQNILCPVEVSAGEKVAQGQAAVQIWSSRQRTARAIRTFALGLVISAISLLIPFLHFVLPPIFLLITLIASRSVYLQQKQILGGYATCPACQKEFSIISGYSEWPLIANCSNCNRPLRIEPKA